MIEPLIQAAARTLHQVFPGTAIYTEEVQQHWKEPCFFLRCVDFNRQTLRGPLHKESLLLEVRYHPKDGNGELWAASAPILHILELLSFLDGICLRGTELQAVASDGALVCTAIYPYHTYERPPQEKPMETIETQTKTKEG